VLLDLTMPKLDGTATFTELRRMDPKVRVVLMSGFNEQDAINRFAGKGLAGFVQKPFKFETLCAKLEAVFQAA
jgi:DNA-binding NtrC family response regulator